MSSAVVGNFDQVGDKPPCNASNSVPTDKKWTGCSLAVSINYGIYHKKPAVWLGDEWWALPLKARAVHWCLTARWSLLIVSMVNDKYIYNAFQGNDWKV